ncbi:MAG: alcohol dehydrogenase catalytic domain-containing protein [Candidatus Gastranaerophilales bacterium]|nr:alcohol dehydrogenase catalytic domain-containing protein [Candidatus Gastranaerophilales bacterium]
MKAIEFNKTVIFRDNYPVPEPQSGEALIKIDLAGICNTDLEIIKGYMNFSGILGHEFVGRVVKINGDRQELVGKRVTGEINCPCKECEYCQKGLYTHCSNRSVLGIYNRNGCFADYITLPVDNLHIIPDSVTDEEAVFTEPLAAAYEILEQVNIKPDDKVLILGDGKLGLLVSLVLNQTAADVLLAGKHEEKLGKVEDQGVKTILPENLEISKQYDIVVEATGSAGGFEFALSLLKPRGILVLKSTVAANKEINLAPVVVDEITVIGSRCGPFKPAINALEKKLFNVKPLISGIYKISKAKEALKLSKTKGCLKVIIDFND